MFSSRTDRASIRRWTIAASTVCLLLILVGGGGYYWWYVKTNNGGQVVTNQFAATTTEQPPVAQPLPLNPPLNNTTQVVSFDWESLPAEVLLAMTENSDAGVASCAIFKMVNFRGEQAQFSGKEWVLLKALVASKRYYIDQERITAEQNRLFAQYGMCVGPGGTLKNVPADHEASFRECLVYAGRRSR